MLSYKITNESIIDHKCEYVSVEIIWNNSRYGILIDQPKQKNWQKLAYMCRDVNSHNLPVELGHIIVTVNNNIIEFELSVCERAMMIFTIPAVECIEMFEYLGSRYDIQK